MSGDCWQVTDDRWQVTGDRWQVTRDMWHMTRDTWHVTNDKWNRTLDTWHMIYFFFFYLFLIFLVLVLISAHVKRFSVSHKQDLYRFTISVMLGHCIGVNQILVEKLTSTHFVVAKQNLIYLTIRFLTVIPYGHPLNGQMIPYALTYIGHTTLCAQYRWDHFGRSALFLKYSLHGQLCSYLSETIWFFLGSAK